MIKFNLDQYDHFTQLDYIHNEELLYLNDDIHEWLTNNIIGIYHLNCDDYVNDYNNCHQILIEFENDKDATAFKLRWL